jgi:hypothetical protein
LRISALGILAGIVPRGENTNYRWPRDISLRFDRRSGLLLFSYAFPGVRTSFPLLTPNDGEAVIAGKGTGLGDAITARDEGGEVFLEWSGLLLKRE